MAAGSAVGDLDRPLAMSASGVSVRQLMREEAGHRVYPVFSTRTMRRECIIDRTPLRHYRYKSLLCREFYLFGGTCNQGTSCTYAHSLAEVQPIPQVYQGRDYGFSYYDGIRMPPVEDIQHTLQWADWCRKELGQSAVPTWVNSLVWDYYVMPAVQRSHLHDVRLEVNVHVHQHLLEELEVQRQLNARFMYHDEPRTRSLESSGSESVGGVELETCLQCGYWAVISRAELSGHYPRCGNCIAKDERDVILARCGSCTNYERISAEQLLTDFPRCANCIARRCATRGCSKKRSRT
jgi:hypothetical protein